MTSSIDAALRGSAQYSAIARSARAQPAEKTRERGASARKRHRHGVEVARMHIAPAPALAALERGDHRVTRVVVVLQRVRVRRILAAADVAAREADAKLRPRLAERQAFLAAVGDRRDIADRIEVLAAVGR